MASSITLSSAVRSNLLSLQKTADLLGKTQEKLATGLKVNSALDDPTAFFTASSLNSRASDLNRLQDFVGNAVQTLKAADEGISGINKLVEAAEATARQALQTAGSTFTAVTVSSATTVAADTAPTVTGSSLTSDKELDSTGLNFDSNDTLEITLNGVTSIINFENKGNGINATTNSGNNYYINLDDADGSTGSAATVTGASVGSNIDLDGSGAGFTNGDTIEFLLNGVTSTLTFQSKGNGIDATANSGNNYYINIDDFDGSTGSAATGTSASTVASATLNNVGVGLANNDQLKIELNGVTSTITFQSKGDGVDATTNSGNNYYINLDDINGSTGTAASITGGTITSADTLLSLGYANNDKLSFTLNGTTYNFNFEAAGDGNAATSNSGTNYYLNLDDYNGAAGGTADATIADLVSLVNAQSGTTNINAAIGTNQITFNATDASYGDLTIAVTDAAGGAAETLLDNLGFTTNSGGTVTATASGNDNASFTDLASVINAITNLDSSFASSKLTIAAASNLGDLKISVVDASNNTNAGNQALLDGLGFTDNVDGAQTFIPGSSTDATITNLASVINNITNLDSSFASNALTISAASNLGDLKITVKDGGSANDTLLNAIGITNNTSTGVYTATPGSSGDATVSTLASLINSITGLDANFTSNQLTIASASHVGDLQIVGKDGGTATNGKVTALGLTTTSTGTVLVEPDNTDLETLTGNLTLQVGSGTVRTITFGTSDSGSEVNTREELLSAINALSDTPNITASFVSNKLQLTLDDNTASLTIGGSSTVLDALNLTAGTTYQTVATTVAARTNFATQFNELRSQIDQLAKDSGFNGVNLLDGDSLTVTFNEDGTSSLGISGVTFSSTGLGITSADNNFQLDSNINASITELKTATATLRSQASKFGSNLSVVETRQEFTKNLINVLETGAANLTLADTNEEGANLLALQTRQQLSSTALSLASQADQNVLRLF